MANSFNRNWWSSTSIHHKLFFLVFLLSFVLVFALFKVLTVGQSSQVSSRNYLLEENNESQREVKLIVDYVDLTVNPCDNFYNFSCGGFIEIASVTGEFTPLHRLEQNFKKRLNALIVDPDIGEVERPLQLQREFYQACLMDNKSNDLSKLKEIIEKLGDWPVVKQRLWRKNDFSWLNLMMKARHLGVNFNHFIRMDVRGDVKFTGLFILSIGPPKITYLDESLMTSYIELMTDVAVILGAEAYPASQQLPGVVDLRIRLKELVDLTRREPTESIMKISELEEKIPWIPWLTYIKNITKGLAEIDENSYVRLRGEEYFRRLQYLIEIIPEQTQANYAIWMIIESLYKFLAPPIRDKIIKFTGAKVENRASICQSKAESFFPSVREIAYVRKYTTPPMIEDLNEMLKIIRKLLISKVKSSDWFDQETKSKAESRLNSIEAFIGWSKNVLYEDFENITSLTTSQFNWPSDDILDMVMALTVHFVDEMYSRINQNYTEYQKTSMLYKPELIVNGCYVPYAETMIFPISLLQGNFYDLHRPHYMNYGAIGTVIGHELTHGLMAQITSYDGKVENWWTDETFRNFDNVTKCLVDGYNNYLDLLTGFTTNGTAALPEYLADFIGVNLAYEAYQEWVSINGAEEPLPGMDYTPNQLFWLSFSSFKCYRPKWGQHMEAAMANSHGVHSFSVTEGLRNSPHFAKDFNCAAGTHMNPETKCIIL